MYSVEYLRYLYDFLCKNRIVDKENVNSLVDLFKELPEILIWGDQNDPKIFEFFSSKNMIMFFVMIIKQKCGAQLTYQILQALNIIFDNINNQESLSYLISNNYMNYIITFDYNFKFDEILAYYISLLKILVTKIDDQTLAMFYDHASDFPILTETIRLYDHKESMVRISVCNIILNILKLKNHLIDSYFINYVSETYFSHLFWKLKTLIVEINDYSLKIGSHYSSVQFDCQELFGHFHFLDDIFEVSSSEISDIIEYFLFDKLFYSFLIPALSVSADSNSDNSVSIKKHTYFFILSQIISTIKYPPARCRLHEILYCSPTTEQTISLLSSWSEPEEMGRMLSHRGVFKRDYGIEHRIQLYLSKLFHETKNPDNVPFDTVSQSPRSSREMFTVPSKMDLTRVDTKYSFKEIKNFSFEFTSNGEYDERGFYYYINLLLQIYNATSEHELIEKFQPNVEIFVHEQLNFLLLSIKTICKKGTNKKLVIVFIVFFLLNYIIKKYKIVRAVIEKSSFIDELYKIKNYFADIFSYRFQRSSKNMESDKNNFLYVLLQIQSLKLSPFFFNNLHQMLIHPDDEEFTKKIKLVQSMSNKDADLSFFIFLKIFQSIEISLNLEHKSLLLSLINFSKETVPVFSSIHSSDYEIASCVVVTHEQRFCGFVTFNDSYIILAEPARSPHYGSLTVKYTCLFNMLSICNTLKPDSLFLTFRRFQSLTNPTKNSELVVSLRFLTDDAMNIVFQKLCSRIKNFDSTYTKYLQKLGITATSIHDVSAISPTETMNSLYHASCIYNKPSQASVLSNIINGGYPQ